ncbi:MAG: hypothetical protein H6620_01655 [Halobacteriovoraceae bacterium]|nr:hypothetical protein [Halobacteriovoraceae bacterium]
MTQIIKTKDRTLGIEFLGSFKEKKDLENYFNKAYEVLLTEVPNRYEGRLFVVKREKYYECSVRISSLQKIYCKSRKGKNLSQIFLELSKDLKEVNQNSALFAVNTRHI